MKGLIERMRRHVASYKSLTRHRADCLELCTEVERLLGQLDASHAEQREAGMSMGDVLNEWKAMCENLESRLGNVQAEADDIASRYDDTWRSLTLAVTWLNKIATWGQGETVTGSFDEPASAEAARKVLYYLPNCGVTPHFSLPENLRDDAMQGRPLDVEKGTRRAVEGHIPQSSTEDRGSSEVSAVEGQKRIEDAEQSAEGESLLHGCQSATRSGPDEIDDGYVVRGASAAEEQLPASDGDNQKCTGGIPHTFCSFPGCDCMKRDSWVDFGYAALSGL